MPDKDEIREDGYLNAVTNAGVVGKDKKVAGRIYQSYYGDRHYIDIYSGSALGHKVATTFPDYMMKKGISFQGDTDGKYQAYLDKIGATKAIHTALIWSYVFGPAVILIGALDGQELDEPLKEKNIRTIPWIKVYDAREMSLTTTDFNIDAKSKDFGNPEYVTISANDQTLIKRKVHKSRLIYFKGILSDSNTSDQLREYFGDSIFKYLYEPIRATESIFSNTETIMQDFVVWKIKIENLVQLLQAGQEDKVKKRVEMINHAKSIMNAVVYGENEDITADTTSVAGLDSIIDRFMMYISGMSEIPVSLLFGRGAQGMNATGEGDMINFYDSVQSKQKIKLDPVYDRLLYLISLAKDFNGPSFDEITYEYNPLHQQSEKEKAETKKIIAETDNIYMSQGVVTPEEIRESRFGGEEYSSETEIDESMNLKNFNQETTNIDELEDIIK